MSHSRLLLQPKIDKRGEDGDEDGWTPSSSLDLIPHANALSPMDEAQHRLEKSYGHDPLAQRRLEAIAPDDRVSGTGGAHHGLIFQRMMRNIAWLLGGRGFAGLLSIAYLALAARGLGPVRFGTFSLIIAFGSSVAALAQFQSGQAVIKFGAVHLAHGRLDRLGQMLASLALLDFASAGVGAATAVIGAWAIAPWLGWAAATWHAAAAFGFVLLLPTGSTATGMLRLFNRFDLLTYTEAVGPVVRMTGAAWFWLYRGSLADYLAVWALAVLAEGLAAWLAALRVKRSRFSFGRGAIRKTLSDNPGLIHFLMNNSASSSLALISQYAGTFAVGHASGAALAGGFRVASKLATAVGKPFDMIARTLYPELARLVAQDERMLMRSVVLRITLVSVLFGSVLIALAYWAGSAILAGLYGRQFAFAYPFFLLLTCAAAVDLCGVALEPVLNAYGRAGRKLLAEAMGAGITVAVMGLLIPLLGAVGAAWAAIVGTIVSRVLMTGFVWWELSGPPGSTDRIR